MGWVGCACPLARSPARPPGALSFIHHSSAHSCFIRWRSFRGLYELSQYAFLADRTGGTGLTWGKLLEPGNGMISVGGVWSEMWEISHYPLNLPLRAGRTRSCTLLCRAVLRCAGGLCCGGWLGGGGGAGPAGAADGARPCRPGCGEGCWIARCCRMRGAPSLSAPLPSPACPLSRFCLSAASRASASWPAAIT